MNKVINSVSSLLRAVFCRLFGHNFVYLRTVNKDVIESRCSRCKVVHAIGYGRSVKVTKEVRELHDKILIKNHLWEQ